MSESCPRIWNLIHILISLSVIFWSNWPHIWLFFNYFFFPLSLTKVLAPKTKSALLLVSNVTIKLFGFTTMDELQMWRGAWWTTWRRPTLMPARFSRNWDLADTLRRRVVTSPTASLVGLRTSTSGHDLSALGTRLTGRDARGTWSLTLVREMYLIPSRRN